ncbi:F-box and WD repeat domain containing protein 10B-like [Watersipora subatra]|uniref:F-box and WD repeat domain containing protein 10B-like n=1 Tax=Watersipora subatra TaxID=2589382 RepID=UPI00355C3691
METVFCEDIPLDRNSEYYEFSVGKAEELRCAKSLENRDCGECESCLLSHSILSTKNWFWRCSHRVKKKFLMGLVQRFHSVDLLKYTVQILKPLISKDFTYARNRSAPSLDTDNVKASSNRALSMADIDLSIKYTWNWFVSSNYWTKSNFLLGLFKLCEVQLLFMVGNHAKTLLSAEIKALSHKDEQFSSRVSSAVVASRYGSAVSAKSAPEIMESSGYRVTSAKAKQTLTKENAPAITTDWSEDDQDDPTLFVAPDSEKALVGVTRYRDYIKELPVHLSKCILGYLDEATLFNCGRVSYHWHVLVEEMRAEFYANQQMWEDIMLMQGSSGVNPNYANDIDILVPNVKADTCECIKLDGEVDPKVYKDERFKSEMNIENAYAGYSSRKVIMEERNLFCGSYNVLVLVNEHNRDRVIHASGGNFLPYSKDRRCHLIDIRTGRDTEHPIAGHSGSIKCVNIQESEGFVLTGSFDTSVRKWDLTTLKCVKIFNGHQDTVVALDYCVKGEQFASASHDKSCKVWNINSKKCYRTFKHRGKVVAVVLSKTQCVTGCEQGRVKVWNLESGHLVKMLLGHDKQISALRFDKWHIVTASLDGYALAWSNQGNHKRCLTALRHPCPVLCMEFLYLRVITGAEDGRVRIWNMVNGQCCRIMRGNSQSDPVLSIYTIGDRMTINTKSNVLMLTFESIEWDYSQETDKVVSLVDNNKYAGAPLKVYSYPYIRAQRMAHADSADERLISKTNKPRFKRMTSAHSARSAFNQGSQANCEAEPPQSKHLTLKEEPELIPTSTAPKVKQSVSMSILPDRIDDDDDNEVPATSLEKRRVSWAFEHPEIPKCSDPSLNEMKTLLKKQIRSETQTPDFIYLTISALKNQVASTYPFEHSNNQEFPNKQKKNLTCKPILRYRPKSSPSSIDIKTKVDISEGLAEFLADHAIVDDGRSVRSGQTSAGRTSHSGKSMDRVASAATAEQRAQSAQMLRVQSAGTPRSKSADCWRVKTAKKLRTRTKGHHGLTTTATETSIVPMLMYPKDGLKPTADKSQIKKWTSQQSIAKNHPLCSDHSLKLRTYTEEMNLLADLKLQSAPTKQKAAQVMS